MSQGVNGRTCDQIFDCVMELVLVLVHQIPFSLLVDAGIEHLELLVEEACGGVDQSFSQTKITNSGYLGCGEKRASF